MVMGAAMSISAARYAPTMLNPPPTSPGSRLRDLVSRGTVVMPGVFNGISALSAVQAGAQALYISGAGITNASFGVPDIGLATLNEFVQHAERICSVADLPVVSDADTGFGEGLNVRRTVVEMERAGLAGIHLEDQENPKRCGHLEGKSLIPADQMAAKVRAAADGKRDPSFWIIARTDARGVTGLEDALERAKRYIDAGADAVFPEGLASEEEFEAFRRAVSVPLMANMTEFGKTQIIPVSRFTELGYEMVIFPMTAFRVMLRSIDEAYAELLSTGTQAGLIDRMRTRQELYALIGYEEYTELDRRWASS
jgi:methylisocitrate lyase